LASIILTQNLKDSVKTEVYKLWNLEYPEAITYSDQSEFEQYLSGLIDPKHFLLYNKKEQLIGWAFTFTREDQRWFAIIIEKSNQELGSGKKLLNEIKANETKLAGWVIDHNNDHKKDGSSYSSPLSFYVKNGFYVCPDIRLETERISAVKIEWTQV
jgi:hypothetical protein